MATALADTDAPQATRLTYPISPEYVATWDAERALTELVANAIDAHRESLSYEWRNGTLVIEDEGEGIPEAGLVLGYSQKRERDDMIGQWGEGAKIASLVLARDPEIGRVEFETVGYSFTPLIVRERLMSIGPEDGAELPEMLAFDITTNTRQRGTKITVECSRALAQRVKRRFRHFEPGYEPAGSAAKVLADGGGKIYIGGLLVSKGRKLIFSYDFPLSYKAVQNRDRTVIDSQAERRMIQTALLNLSERELVERWIDAALAGELPQLEQCFSNQPIPAQRRVIGEIFKERFGDRKLAYVLPGDRPEAHLYCDERGYTVLEPQIEAHPFNSLMSAAGVPRAQTLYKEPRTEKTSWLRSDQLTEDERATLEQARQIIVAVHGTEALERLDVYSETRIEDEDETLAFGGFFEPTTTRIGLKRDNLASLKDTLAVLAHEAGHRRRFLVNKYDYKDNCRGFESELTTMLGEALHLLAEEGLIEKLAERAAERERAAALAKSEKDSADRDHERTHPAGQTRRLLADAMQAEGLERTEDLATAAGVSAGGARKMLRGSRRNGHRDCPAPKLPVAQAVAEALGLEWAVVQLGLLCESGIAGEPVPGWGGRLYLSCFSRRGRKRDQTNLLDPHAYGSGRIIGVRGDEIEACIARLRELGEPEELIAPIEAQLNAPFETEDGTWAEPYRELIARERARRGL